MKNLPKILVFLLMFSCKNEVDNKPDSVSPLEKIKIIDLSSALNNSREIFLSDIVKDIEYVQLELTSASAIKTIFDVSITKEYIFVHTNGRILQFYRNGKFLRQVGRNGKGPGEYYVPTGFFVNEKRNRVCIKSSHKNEIIIYDFDGNFINHIKTGPAIQYLDLLNDSSIVIHRDMGMQLVDRNYFVAGVISYNGDTLYINKNRVSEKLLFKDFTKRDYRKKANIKWYCNNDLMLYNVMYDDTVYHITEVGMLPKYILNYDKYKFPFEEYFRLSDYLKKEAQYFVFQGFLEDDDNLFISFSYRSKFYLAQYEKKTGKIFVDSQVKKSAEKKYSFLFINNIDGGLDVFPVQSQPKLGYTIMYPYHMLEKLTPEHFTNSTAIYKDKKKAFIELMGKIHPDDNPIIAIYRFH